MNSNYKKKIINIIFILILIIASINWSLSINNYNLVEILNTYINNTFNINVPINNYIYYIIAIIAILVAFNRDIWLPFLGETVLPSSLIPLSTPNNYNKVLTIQADPNSKIIYWSSLPDENNKIPDVSIAYKDYSNCGCVMSNDKGEALLSIVEGTSYKVPIKNEIKKHVHYRVFNESGILSKVYTIYY